jgi:hypothetical protein
LKWLLFPLPIYILSLTSKKAICFLFFQLLFYFSLYRPFKANTVGVYEKLLVVDGDEEAANLPSSLTNQSSSGRKPLPHRKSFRRSNKLAAVVLPKFVEPSTLASSSSPLHQSLHQSTDPIKPKPTFEPLSVEMRHEPIHEDDRDYEEDDEEYEKELIVDSALWQKANLKMKARLLSTQLQYGAERTMKSAVKKTKKAFSKKKPLPKRAQDEEPDATSSISLFDRHFAAGTAIRDFNESMPVVVLPSTFQVKKGKVIQSDPATRIQEYEEQQKEQQKELQQRQQRMKQQSEKPRKTISSFTIQDNEEDN